MVENKDASVADGKLRFLGNAKWRDVGGQLLFLCIVLTLLAPLFTVVELINTYQLGFDYLTRSTARAVGTSVIVFGDLITRTYGVYAGLKLWRVEPGAVRIGKRYFILNIVICVIQLFFVGQVVQEGLREQQTQGAIRELMIAIVVSGWWYNYLNKSQRVKDTYGPTIQEHKNVNEPSPSQASGPIGSQLKATSSTVSYASSRHSTAVQPRSWGGARERPRQEKVLSEGQVNAPLAAGTYVHEVWGKIRALNLAQRLALWVGLMLALVMIVWPPWLATYTAGQDVRTKPFGYHFILHPTPADEIDRLTELFPEKLALFDESDHTIRARYIKATMIATNVTYRIDFERLSIQLGILVVAVSGLMWALAGARRGIPNLIP